MTAIPELTATHFDRSIRASLRRRLVEGDFRTGEDIVHRASNASSES